VDDIPRLELLQRDGRLHTPLRRALFGQLGLTVLELAAQPHVLLESPRWQVIDSL